jgi:hypothetical protein
MPSSQLRGWRWTLDPASIALTVAGWSSGCGSPPSGRGWQGRPMPRPQVLVVGTVTMLLFPRSAPFSNRRSSSASVRAGQRRPPDQCWMAAASAPRAGDPGQRGTRQQVRALDANLTPALTRPLTRAQAADTQMYSVAQDEAGALGRLARCGWRLPSLLQGISI